VRQEQNRIFPLIFHSWKGILSLYLQGLSLSLFPFLPTSLSFPLPLLFSPLLSSSLLSSPLFVILQQDSGERKKIERLGQKVWIGKSITGN
jgi:hypothetical protein